ncbi:MAG: AAA family ATPase [Halioglobus sp.]|nr:AAA family ATPase [Halioglobus sp.]
MADAQSRDISLWLTRIGMPQFTEIFVCNGVDFDLLPELTSSDLHEMGVARLADRKRILSEIRLLSVEKARHSVQRRLLSVFFCDMVGSTARSTEIDPEELRFEMKLYQDTVVKAVNQHGGFVARFTGDGVLAYFGWPHADEDQASQAVRAGLDAIRTVSELKLEAGFTAHCRIGIATGRVVVGGQPDLDSAFGETPNLAARLQSLADIDRIVIDMVTRRAIGDRFIVESLQSTQLKGFEQPVSAFAVVRERPYLDRFDSRGGASSLFVGREQELDVLYDAWTRTQSGRGVVMLIRGEPGIGKSRLVKRFCDFCLPEGTPVLQYQCSAHHTNSAFYPLIQRLEQIAGIDTGCDSDAVKFEKISQALHPSIVADARALSLIAQLLSIGGVATSQTENLSAQERRSQTAEVLIENGVRRTGGAAQVIVVEDAHWIDPSTRMLLETLMAKAASAPILVLVTCRLGEQLRLAPSAQFDELELQRLDEDSVEQLAVAVDLSGVLSPSDIRNIVKRADGVPLFAEEIALAAIEHGSRGETFELPESIEASISARLDNLGDAKLPMQVAAVMGREFRLSQCQSLSAVPEPALLGAMATAIASGLLQEVKSPGDRTFRFTHALVQDVAYNGLLKQQRRELHKRLATEVLDDTFRQREPEVVAYHLTQAGETELAIDYWQRAASRAGAASANAEAIAHFQQGLRLIPRLPEDEHRYELEFGLFVGMAMPLIVEKGYTSDELEQCIGDALAISRKVKYTPAIYSLLFSQWGFKLTFGLIEDALRVATEFSELAVRQNDDIAQYASNRMLGATHMCLGKLQLARSELSRLIADYRTPRHAALSSIYGVDLRVAGRCFLAEVLWLLGDIDGAKVSADRALAEARAMQHLHSHAIALHFCGLVSFLNRDREAVRTYISEMMLLAKDHVIGAWPTLGGAMLGWALLEDGAFEEKLTALENGVAAARKLGVGMFVPFFYCRIAEVMMSIDRCADARQYLRDARALMAQTKEALFRGELLQLEAQLCLRDNDPEAAQRLFAQGLAHARSQGARSVELRVANAYASYLLDRGDVAAALDMLQPLLAHFADTTDSEDLRTARDLLARLQPGAGGLRLPARDAANL